MPDGSVPDRDSDLRRSLVELLRELLGSQVELAGLEIIKRLLDYRVVLVELEEPCLSLVVKMAGSKAPLGSAFDRTAALLELVAQQTTVPVARVVGLDVSCQRWPFRWLAITRLAGLQWARVRADMNETEQNNVYTQIGEAVAQLHAIQFSGFGELPPDLNLPAGDDFVAAWQKRAEDFISDQRLRDSFLSTLQKQKVLFTEPGPPSLCHEDLHGYNLLIEERDSRWQLSAILDFDKAWAGCRESDLARLEFWDGMTSPSFWQAYRSNLPIGPLYQQRKLLFQLFWCLEYAATTPRHQKDTERVCRALKIPVMKFLG